MKTTNFFKAVAVMAIAVLSTPAYAQNESDNEDSATVVAPQVSNQKAGAIHYGIDPQVASKDLYGILKDNRADTIVTEPVEVFTDTTVTRCGYTFELTSEDTLFVHLKYSLNGPRSIRRDTLCILNEHVTEEIPVMSNLERKVRRLALETAVLDTVQSGRSRDRYAYRVSFDNGNTYTITDKGKDKYGVFAGVYAGGQTGSGLNGFRGGVEAGYSWSWGLALAQVGASHNRYTENATLKNRGRKMWAFEARAGVGPTLYFGKYKKVAVSLLAGISETSFKTDSREVVNPDGSIDIMQSGGNAWSWWVGVRGTYRGFNGIGMVNIQIDYTKVPNIIQNQGQIGQDAVTFTASFDVDFFRGLVNNHK